MYLYFEKDTAIYEMHSSIGQKYSLTEFKINKKIKMAELSEETIKTLSKQLFIPFFGKPNKRT